MSQHAALRLGVTQFAMHELPERNLACAVDWVRAAHAAGAQVVLLPELFTTHYFPREMDKKFFAWAHTLQDDPSVRVMSELARELSVVIPVSFFERAGDAYYNSLVVLDADGSSLGVYRKTHIPDGTGYDEKYYFRPGDTGFRSFVTRYADLGVGICWDQWFPECARALALLGADILLYPTAIGTEPTTARDTSAAWRRVMVGHAVSNTSFVAASNRVGNESGQAFYGTSFLANPWGDVCHELGRVEEGMFVADLDLAQARLDRDWMGLLRDRRPEMYTELTRRS